jgi:DNA polymerase III delta prime subunit
MKSTVESHDKMPHLLLIAGNGRNVGKTYLACNIIRYFSKQQEVTGLKISPHFHPVTESEILFSNEHFIITNENQINTKDSSLMLQAGAKEVFFVMVKPGFIAEAFEKLQPFLPETLIVCESGQLHEVVTPGLFLFVKRAGDEIVKPEYLKHSPLIINNDGNYFDFDIQNIQFENKGLNLIPEKWESLKR